MGPGFACVLKTYFSGHKFSVEKFDFLIDGRARASIDKFIATNPKFEDICEELRTYTGYVDQTQEITSLEYFTVVR